MKLSALICMALVVAMGCEESPAALDERPTPTLTKEERKDRFKERQDEAVGYSNPNTGYSADYTLDVEYTSDGEVDRINFPNSGWEDDFTHQENNGDGTITVTDEDGREWTVPAMDDPDADTIDPDEEEPSEDE